MGILGGIAAPAVSGRTGDGHRCDSRRFGPSVCYAYSVCRRFDPGDLRPHVGGLAWQRVMVLTQMSEIAILRQLRRVCARIFVELCNQQMSPLQSSCKRQPSLWRMKVAFDSYV